MVRIKLVTCEFATSHLADGMDEIMTIEIFKSILVGIVGVGTTIKLVCQRIFDTVLVVSVLRRRQNMCYNED